MDRFRATVGAPELVGKPGTTLRLTQCRAQIHFLNGFRALDLAQMNGMILALDWVVGRTHRIWGSAVMVAPGVALTAGHVVAEMRRKGFLQEVGGYLLALGFHEDHMVIWNPNSFTSVGNGDLSILTLARATESDPAASQEISVKVATMAARQPGIGERVSLVGFAASETEFELLTHDRSAGLSLVGSIGAVLEVYSAGRDRNLPNPSAAVAAKTVGGMSGGAAFDELGRLIGVISTGMGEDTSFISLCWPSAFTPVENAWPSGLIQMPATLHSMALQGLCGIEHIEALSSHIGANGEPVVGLTHDLGRHS